MQQFSHIHFVVLCSSSACVQFLASFSVQPFRMVRHIMTPHNSSLAFACAINASQVRFHFSIHQATRSSRAQRITTMMLPYSFHLIAVILSMCQSVGPPGASCLAYASPIVPSVQTESLSPLESVRLFHRATSSGLDSIHASIQLRWRSTDSTQFPALDRPVRDIFARLSSITGPTSSTVFTSFSSVSQPHTTTSTTPDVNGLSPDARAVSRVFSVDGSTGVISAGLVVPSSTSSSFHAAESADLSTTAVFTSPDSLAMSSTATPSGSGPIKAIITAKAWSGWNNVQFLFTL